MVDDEGIPSIWAPKTKRDQSDLLQVGETQKTAAAVVAKHLDTRQEPGRAATMGTWHFYRWSGLVTGLLGFLFAACALYGQGTFYFPPGGQMTELQNGALLRSIGPTTLRARMSADRASITEVRFYSDSNLLGTAVSVSSNEFTLSWSPGRTGIFNLHATAVDSRGKTGTTAKVTISVATNLPSYSVIELESFNPYAINNHGLVVGSFSNTAAYWTQWRSEIIDVYGARSAAKAVNDDGTIVGEFVQAEGQSFINYQAFCYSPALGLRILPGLSDGRVNAVSRAGIIGLAATNYPPWNFSGFLYDGTNYTFFDIEGLRCNPSDINDEGVIVGSITTPTNVTLPFLRRAGELTLLREGLGLNAINQKGQAVGTAGGNAILYDNGTVTDIGVAGFSSQAFDINDHGTAVGCYYPQGSINLPSGFIFYDGVMIDLHHLIPTNSGWHLHSARSINNQGWIVGLGSRSGDGFFPRTGTRGFLLVPKPMLYVTRATAAAVEGIAYPANGEMVFEKSNDLVKWQPIFTNSACTAEVPFSFSVDTSAEPAFYRVVQPSTP